MPAVSDAKFALEINGWLSMAYWNGGVPPLCETHLSFSQCFYLFWFFREWFAQLFASAVGDHEIIFDAYAAKGAVIVQQLIIKEGRMFLFCFPFEEFENEEPDLAYFAMNFRSSSFSPLNSSSSASLIFDLLLRLRRRYCSGVV